MKFCSYCGIKMNDKSKYCQKCGRMVEIDSCGIEKKSSNKSVDLSTIEDTPLSYQEIHNVKESDSKKMGYLQIFLRIIASPIMLIRTIYKNDSISVKTKRIIIIIITILFLCVVIIGNKWTTSEERAYGKFEDIKMDIRMQEYEVAIKDLNKLIVKYPEFELIDEAKILLEDTTLELERIREERKVAIEKRAENDRVIAEKKEIANKEASDKAEAEAEAKAEAKAEAEVKVKAEVINQNIRVIMDTTTLNEEESIEVFEVLKSVGFGEISSMKKGFGTSVDTLLGFVGVCDGMTTIITIEERKAYYVAVGKIELYDSTRGGVLNDIGDFIITSSEKIEYLIYVEDLITQVLKAPKTADFPGRVLNRDQWSLGRNKDLVQVSSYVDSQNSFGAMIRSDFTVQISYSTGELLCVVFDGEVLYGEIQKNE